MSFLDKILNAFKLNDDYDDDDFLDDEMENYDEKPSKTKVFKKSQADSFDELDDDDSFDEEPIMRKSVKQPVKTLKTASSTKAQKTVSVQPKTVTSSKISPIRTRKEANDMSVCVVKPQNMEDAREITETLLANCTVVLNLEGLDMDLAQRIIDFTSGSCYAMSGNLQKISNYIFIITPASVDVSGDFNDILGGYFDVPSMNFNN